MTENVKDKVVKADEEWQKLLWWNLYEKWRT